MKCPECGKNFKRRYGYPTLCVNCLPDNLLTPLQLAKRYNDAYVKLIIDQRHLRPISGGKITIEGPVSVSELAKANALLTLIVDGEG